MKGETPIFLFESRFQRRSRAPMSRLQGSGPWRVNGRGGFHFRARRVDPRAECALGHVGGGCSTEEAQKP
ncbi:hypothetical protein ES332_A08G095800v1 [Gossypium tomentosum]|uniref:Uncharacterized protein n=1 Tax=Gossypium tomentosum TaxID=34277 RepID=A0A5D2PDM5_GOSTO|nr:hypothetical protein ES332_A08G095800v1 [Gossypium tomentosum]